MQMMEDRIREWRVSLSGCHCKFAPFPDKSFTMSFFIQALTRGCRWAFGMSLPLSIVRVLTVYQMEVGSNL